MMDEKRVSPLKLTSRNSDDNQKVIEGYAAVFNTRSKLIAENDRVFYEYIATGAFDNVLADRTKLNAIAVVDHERSTILARTRSNTLELGVDKKGLWFRFSVPNTPYGNHIWEMVQRGDLDECSFRYGSLPKNIEYSRNEAGELERTIKNVDILADVSICIDGAFGESTEVSARGLKEFLQTEEQERNTPIDAAEIQIDSMNMSLSLLEK